MGNGALGVPARFDGAGLERMNAGGGLVAARANRPGVAAAPAGLGNGLQGMTVVAGFQRVEEAAFRLTLSQTAMGAAGTPGSETGAVTRQLDFSFVREMREAALVQFNMRTQQVANAQPAGTRTSFLEASRQVAARFSLSLQVSETVLNGFANAAEAANGSANGLDRLVALTQQVQTLADELLNRIYGMFDDFIRGEGTFDQRVNRFLEAFRGLDLSGLFQGSGAQGQTRTVGVQLEFAFMVSEQVSVGVQEADPIVLDLTGDGINLTSYRDGARFDITGDGRKEQVAFVTGGDAFLAIDRNGNGVIDDGTELFGDQNGARNGFEELRRLDTNGDGIIDERDADFDKLLLWRDNGNGITEPGELMTLREAGIQSISLNYRDVDMPAAGGNRLTQIASFTWSDGRVGKAADAMLNYTV